MLIVRYKTQRSKRYLRKFSRNLVTFRVTQFEVCNDHHTQLVSLGLTLDMRKDSLNTTQRKFLVVLTKECKREVLGQALRYCRMNPVNPL